uniref:NPC intracellular cholesterol transporter 2-like n=1 Tax=Diabrotica virgifera virgifera TaxID=50390 RepID=A0A6P7FHY1_DIAVI
MALKKVMLNVVSLIFILSVSQCSVNNLTYSDCGSKHGSITNVHISGCEGKDACPLYKGTYAYIDVTFRSGVKSYSLTAEAYGKIGIFYRKLELPDPNACNYGVDCPIRPYETYTYSIAIYIDESFPSISLVLELHLKDDTNTDVVCGRQRCRIVDNLPVVIQII